MSSETPKEPPRPGRLIVPGAESEPEPSAAPRIVLPPGVSAGRDDEVPEHPRLRPLVLVPFSDGQRDLVLVSDPLGVIPGQPVLGIEALAILQLLDGSVSLTDLTAALMRENKDLRMGTMVRDFVRQLDDLLMLDSPRFEAAYRELREAWHQLEIRPAALEGKSYPAERAECEAFLDAHFAAAEALRAAEGQPAAAPDALPRALLAPHLDPRRSGPALARALLELGAEQKEPLRVVVFGTGHSLMDERYALTRKHFETPLGKLPCDTAFVDALVAKLGDAAWHGELAHRDEHSIEFAALYLLKRLAGRPVKMVPILCGGFGTLLDEGKTARDDAGFEAMLAAVRETEQKLGGPTVYVAAADLSHVGPRFGDPALEDGTREEIDGKDRAALAAAQKGDADGWFQAIAAHDDSTRICGYAPVYALLRCAGPGTGRLLRYEQSGEKDSTIVSIAAMVWP
ncbi:MAG: AmmeMemoRadiSam system protein B [Candidatus Eisenbacteria bacterium]|nr:AmmeMemoRadiSam system protein B [Candidatus Eisenbacteria bacterium]